MTDPTLIIGTFNYFVPESEIKEMISKLVEVTTVELRTDPASGKSLGIAIVTLKNKSDCDNLIKALSESKIEDLVDNKEKIIGDKLSTKPWSNKNEYRFICESGQFSHTSSKGYYENELKKLERSRGRSESKERKRSKSRHSRSHSRHYKGSKRERRHSRSGSRHDRHRQRSRSPRRDNKDRDKSKRSSHRH